MVIGLGPAAGEHDFLRSSADERRDLFSRGFDGGASPLAGGVNGGSIAKFPREIGKHCVEDFRLDGRRGVVIEVDPVHRATHRILPADINWVWGSCTEKPSC